MQITQDLKWNNHIADKCSAAIRRWYNLSRATRINDPNALIILYKSLVRPILEFPSIIFNPINPGLISKLEKIQRRITRNILFKCSQGNVKMKYEDRLKFFRIDSLEERRNKLDVMYYFKIINGLVKLEESKIPKIRQHIGTRNQNKMAHHRFARLLVRRQSYFIRAPKLYSRLPSFITNSTSTYDFNIRIKKFNFVTC